MVRLLMRPDPGGSARMDAAGWVTLATGIALLALCVSGARATGTSWDESEHRRYGEMALDFYGSLGRERAATTDVMRYYGALHALAGALAERILPAAPWPTARHLAVVLFGMVGFAYAVRLARLLAGPWAGALAALLLATTPRWVGDTMYNPVDVPTAAMFTAAVYHLARLAGGLERARLRDWTAFGIFSGLTLAVRLIGLLLVPWAALLIVSWMLLAPRPRVAAWRRHLPGMLRGLGIAALVTLGVAMALWPRFLVEPWKAIADSLARTRNYPWPGDVLFRAQYYPGHALPPSYLAVLLFVTAPLATLVGLVLGPATRVLRRGSGQVSLAHGLRTGVLFLALGFPPLYAALTHATLYDGIRHFLFLLPALTVLAAVGWCRALRLAARTGRGAWLAGAFVLGALVLEPVVWYARAHPLEYVYFNPLAGGLERASHAYDTDYWGLSLRSAAGWLVARRAAAATPGEVLDVATNAPWHLIEPWLDEPQRYRKVGPEDPFHLLLLWCRYQPAGWELLGSPVAACRVVPGQVPFWQGYVGPLTTR